jgi:hypothetical protein
MNPDRAAETEIERCSMKLVRQLRKWLATWEQIFIGELLAVTIPVTEQRR